MAMPVRERDVEGVSVCGYMEACPLLRICHCSRCIFNQLEMRIPVTAVHSMGHSKPI